MNKLSPTQALGWLIGLLLLFSWNLQVQANPGRIAPRHPVQSNEFFNGSNPAIDPPLSLTAAVGTLFRYQVPVGPFTGNVSVTGLPANGLSLNREGSVQLFITGIPLMAGVMSLTLNTPEQGVLTTRELIITVNPPPPPPPPLPPISLTAMVGTPFNYQLPITAYTTNTSALGLPANGLSLTKIGFEVFIRGRPITAGVLSVTVINTESNSAPVERVYTITVSPPPPPPPPISLTATVGTPFRYQLSIGPYTANVSVTGLPANGLSLVSFLVEKSIEGIPLTAGVMSLTFNSTETQDNIPTTRVIIITVNPPPPPPPPISLTATVGTSFSYSLPTALIPSTNVIYTAIGLPANGLSFTGSPIPPTISGTPTTAGVLSVTITATPNNDPTLGPPVSALYTITIDPAPDTPPVEPVITSLTATVGTSFSYSLPTALIPSTNVIYTAIGLPANGLSFTGSPIPPTISGTPTTAGVLSVTITATPNNDPTLGPPVSALYIITINPATGTPPGGGALTLLAPTYNCATGAFTFNTSGGDGSPITFAAIGITGPTTNPNQFVDVALRTAADAPLITLSAIQNGTLVTYVWNIRAVCPVGPGTPPVNPPGGALTLLAPTYNCATGAFTFNTSGGNGSAITFSAIGITGPTTNPNQFVDAGLRTAADAPLITLLATQNGTTVTYVWNIRAQCPVSPATPPVNPPTGSALTLLAPTYNCATGAFTFNTSGGNATPIEYRAVPGITDWTTNPNQFVDEGSRTASDVQPFLLQARQGGAVTTLVWDLKAACGRARIGAADSERRLRVVVLGNPVVGETVPVEVSGAEGQPLRVSLTNAQGRPVSEERIEQAAATERVRVKLGRSAGVYLLQVSSPDQTKVVRLLKTE